MASNLAVRPSLTQSIGDWVSQPRFSGGKLLRWEDIDVASFSAGWIFMGIFSCFRVRELFQQGDLDGALAEVERVIGLGKSVEVLDSVSGIVLI